MTLCGCVKFESVPSPAPQEIRVPIASVNHDGPNFYRTFRLRTFNPTDAPVEADYIEVFS